MNPITKHPKRNNSNPRPDADVQRLYRLQEQLGILRASGMTWRKIATRFGDIPAATLNAIFKHGRIPRNNSYRRTLGFSTLRTVRANPRPWLPMIDMPNRELARAMRERRDYRP